MASTATSTDNDMSVEHVAALIDREGSGLTPDEYDETPHSEESVDKRTDVIRPVVHLCQDLLESKPEALGVVAETLANGSRDVAWRLPFGRSGVLDFFLGLLSSSSLRPEIQRHALRLVGNSCADTNENRARVVDGDHLVSIIRLVPDEDLITLTIPVLYNVLVDYEPAQIYASKACLSKELSKLLESPGITNHAPYVSYICKILGLLVTHEGEPERASCLLLDNLLNLCENPAFNSDASDFLPLLSAASAYLASEAYQKHLAESPKLNNFLNIIHKAYTSLIPIEAERSESDDPEMAESLNALKATLRKALTDISTHDECSASHPPGSPVQITLLSFLKEPNPSLQSAACIALGNLARSDDASTAMVNTYRAHEPLVKVLSDPATSDAILLHASLSFLKNLAIPAENKPILGELLEPQRVPRIFSMDTLPEVQFSAMSLTRVLLIKCPDNVKRACKRLHDSSSPGQTILSSICSLFERTDAEPTKMEAARAVTAICRVLHTDAVQPILADWNPEGPHAESSCRELFYSEHRLASPLKFLISQDKFPSLLSETLFVLALMCRSKDGGGLVIAAIHEERPRAALLQVITRDATSPGSSPAQLAEVPTSTNEDVAVPPESFPLDPNPQKPHRRQKSSTIRMDRENAMLIFKGLLQNWQDADEAHVWKDLIKEGMEAISADRGETL